MVHLANSTYTTLGVFSWLTGYGNSTTQLTSSNQSREYIDKARHIWPTEFDLLFAEKTNRLHVGTTYGRSGRPQQALQVLSEALIDKSPLTRVESAHNGRVELSRARTYRHRLIHDFDAAQQAAEQGLEYALASNREGLVSELRKFLADL